MASRIPTNVQNALANQFATLVDAGAGPGTIEIRTGGQPATANLAATGTILVIETINDPAFAAAVAGALDLDVTPTISSVGVAVGNAGWARLKDSTGATCLDVAVSLTGGGGELQMPTLAISVGLPVTMTAGSVAVPAST